MVSRFNECTRQNRRRTPFNLAKIDTTAFLVVPTARGSVRYLHQIDGTQVGRHGAVGESAKGPHVKLS